MQGVRRAHLTCPFAFVDEFPDVPSLQYGTCSQCNAENVIVFVLDERRLWQLCEGCKCVRDHFRGTEKFCDLR
jgi:hypothetical protein